MLHESMLGVVCYMGGLVMLFPTALAHDCLLEVWGAHPAHVCREEGSLLG